MEPIVWVMNTLPKTADAYLPILSLAEVRQACAFHQSIPGYEPTPLVHLNSLAQYLGIQGLFLKDESYRFGLNAFKVLGGVYAMCRLLAPKIGAAFMDYPTLTAKTLGENLGQFTFFSATDGNHGRGVAWAANQLGQKAVIFMPKGSSQARLQHILDQGATATIQETNYDGCVRLAAAAAQQPNRMVIQDTAWEGYQEVPGWIMTGYGTMAKEAAEQLKIAGVTRPSHIFIQAGVGSVAGAVQGYFANLFPGNCPKLIVVEATQAACLYQGAVAGDGRPQAVGGEMPTIMAGLACGEPNLLAWDLLKNHATCFVACPDWVAAKGMRMLAAPLPGDPQVISGESGAVNLGLIATLLASDDYQPLRQAIGLDAQSTILTFSTEGNTDPESYRRIVWEGAYPSA